jgi:ammonia channel protein AmtB
MTETKNQSAPLFSKQNYTWMLIGAALIALGFFLMSGGSSKDPQVFDYNEVYSKTRVTVAPILIVLGLAVEIYAIFKKPKA